MSKSIKRFNNLQSLRGIAALLVVMFHLRTLLKQFTPGTLHFPNLFKFGFLGVDIFFVISGFVMMTITRGKFQQPGAATQFLTNRITRIYPVYWFYTLLAFMLISVDVLFTHKELTHAPLLQSLLLWPQDSLPVLAVGWTLVYEMYFYFIIALLLFLPEKKSLAALGLWALFVGIGSHFSFASAGMQVATNPLAYEFMAGYLIARFQWSVNKIFDFSILMGGTLLFVGACLARSFIWPEIPVAGWVRVALFGIPSMVVIYAAVALEFNGVIFPKILHKLGDASYSIYLCHLVVFLVVKHVFLSLYMQKIISQPLMALLMFASAIGLGILSYHYLEKPLMRYFRNRSLVQKPVLEH